MRIFAVLLSLVISNISNAEPVYTNPTVTSSGLMEVADKKARLKNKGQIMKELVLSHS